MGDVGSRPDTVTASVELSVPSPSELAQLEAQISGEQAILTWTEGLAGPVLEHSSDLVLWQPVVDVSVDGYHAMPLEDERPSYFRLRFRAEP